jgi:peptidyl-prolyl cis-trans isomerase D
MFDFVRTHTRLFQFLLLLVIFPSFVLVGISGYNRFTDSANATVATVAGHNITRAEFDAAHRTQVERIRRQAPGVDVKLFDTPQLREQVLEGLIRERVLDEAARKLNLGVSDQRLVQLMRTDPQLASVRKPNGDLDRDLYLQALAAAGISPVQFEASYTRRQVIDGVTGSAFAPAAVAATALDAFFQQREVQLQRFDPKDYAAKVAPTEAEIEAFYKDAANAALFQAPEQADIEYVVLDLETLQKSVTVSEAQLRDYYTQNAARYMAPEERRASHILIKADKSAPADVRAKAKAKAEALLAEVKKNPSSFAELARKNSEDPGSAARGGDLDFFARGAMVKPFEDAAFSLKPGQISGLVESDFGYHVIEVTGVRGGEKKSFEEVRPELEAEFRRQEAQKKFAQVAVDFSNMVYEQSDSLKPVVDKFKLELRSARGVKRTPSPDAAPPLNSQKFLDALFANDIVRNKRNTDAVETAPNQLASGRVVQYAAAHVLPLAEVKDAVRQKLVARQAAALARKTGEAKLAELKKNPQAALSGETQAVSRATAKDLPRPVVDAVLRADTASLPAAVGVDLGDSGYAVARVTKIIGRDPVAADTARAQSQYAQAFADAEAEAYYASLKSRLKAEVKDKNLVAADAPAAPAK